MPGRAHFEHNEQASNFLLSSEQFDDWVIVTSFYAAIHLVDHEIFPITIGHQEYETFKDYYKSKGKGTPPHKVRLDFVESRLPKRCGDAFDWLYERAHEARYEDHRVRSSDVIKALEEFDIIKQVCDKK